MARVGEYQNLLIVLMLLNLTILISARPISILNTITCPDDDNEYFDHLSMGSIKDAGPNPGIGHGVEDKAILGEIKAGPSPGIGHGYTLGGIKDGAGLEFMSIQTLGGIKEGPSPGIGHKFENVESLEGRKDSGPSPGVGH